MTRARVLIIIGLALGGGTPARASTPPVTSPAPAGSGCRDGARGAADPLTELRQSDLALSAALKRHVPDWSPEAQVHAARIEQLLQDILDYEAIAKQALGSHWQTLSPAQRVAFLSLFSPLTNRALLSAVERRVSVSYDSESISGAEATVVVIPRFADGAARPVTQIEYRLGERCGRWRIHDVSVDGVSLVDGYHAQFERLFRRGSFDDLLATMRRRLGRTATP
ncbi:MAG TPA: ABC transporter substrate-binding protein [Polyangia bacterium]|nr:ABC transporter substrate-binding protein [Polyangia bacterium]